MTTPKAICKRVGIAIDKIGTELMKLSDVLPESEQKKLGRCFDSLEELMNLVESIDVELRVITQRGTKRPVIVRKQYSDDEDSTSTVITMTKRLRLEEVDDDDDDDAYESAYEYEEVDEEVAEEDDDQVTDDEHATTEDDDQAAEDDEQVTDDEAAQTADEYDEEDEIEEPEAEPSNLTAADKIHILTEMGKNGERIRLLINGTERAKLRGITDDYARVKYASGVKASVPWDDVEIIDLNAEESTVS